MIALVFVLAFIITGYSHL